MSKQWYMLAAMNESEKYTDNEHVNRFTCMPGDVVGWLDRNKTKDQKYRYRAFLFPQMTEVTETHVNMRLLRNTDPTVAEDTKAEEST